MKVHCFFEQSGTFKNEFKKLGFEAYDYDIANKFGETDKIIDLFGEITLHDWGYDSIFDYIKKDDLIFAFFPCTRFSKQSILSYTATGRGCNKWNIEKKIRLNQELINELARFNDLLNQLVLIAIKEDFKLIIENPYSSQHFLTRYWCLTPAIIHKNRREYGDFFIKPTQYFFVNLDPKNNDCEILKNDVPQLTIDKIPYGSFKRSIISPQYANNFIRKYIL